ncbi:wall-associated receptor kinase-like 6 [Malus sylvestris]|uniref:wall-associated receptor kinase-like 6 n=1 Tax=Malus sylvestris TaxID=3752 RepID=UPI0021AD4D0B|nr:wall-associated receptor kinase-like 6 [Malus sylvestris]
MVPQLPNFTGSPFLYSEEHNQFTAVSCGLFAFVKSYPDQRVVGGCMSACDTSAGPEDNYGCIGINCCQIALPRNLSVIDADIKSESEESTINGKGGVSVDNYAFLVQQDWFYHNLSNFRDVKDMDSVPVVLEWSISLDDMTNSLVKLYKEFVLVFDLLPNGSPQIRKFDSTPFCMTYITSYAYNQSKLKCFCPVGFEGNPYLLQPCPGLVTSLGILLIVVGSWYVYKVTKKRRKNKRKEMVFKRNGGLLLEQKLSSGEKLTVEKIKLFKSKELEKSTDNFNINRILGHGGQGTVYKGMLTDGRIVAVRKSEVVGEGKLSQFINGVVLLSQYIND